MEGKRIGQGENDTDTETPKCLKQKVKVNNDTFPLKVTLFLSYGALSALMPYLTVHMQEIGISINEVAVIYSVLPVTSFLGPLLLSFAADRLGDYKWVIIISTFGNGFFHTMLVFVPTYKGGIPVSTVALVRWTPNLEQGFLVPLKYTHCPGFNEVLEKGLSLSVTQCQVPVSEERGEANGPSPFQPMPALHFTLQDKYNCSARLEGVGNYTDFVPESRWSEEFLCNSNLTYWPGETTEIGNSDVTFWLYFVLRMMGGVCIVTSITLIDATTLTMVKRCGKAEYGRERIWSILGSALVSPIAGTLVDRLSHATGHTDYSPAFYVCDILLLCSIISFRYLKFEVDKPEEGVLRNGLKLLKYPEVLVFLLMIFLLGMFWGFVESYLFVFLKELEAPNYLLGLTLTVGSIVGMPFLWGSEKIVAKFGRVNLIIGAFLMYFVRFFGYSYLQDPFWCFPFEALEAFTVHMMWIAAATYCSLLAPKGLLATLMAVMGSLHYSFGKGAGSFLGGISYGALGARLTFRYFGIVAGMFAIIFKILDFCWVKQVVERRLVAEKAERDEPGGQEIIFHRTSITRRQSIFDANPFSKTTAMISLTEEEAVSE